MSYYNQDTTGTYTSRVWTSGFLFAAFIAATTTALVFAWNHQGQEMAPLLMIAALSLLGSVSLAVNGHSNLQIKKG